MTIGVILKDASRRIATLDLGGWVWIALLTMVMVAADFAMSSIDTRWIAGLSGIAAGVLVFAGFWVLSRKLGRARPDEQGSVLKWLLWSILALLPGVIAVIAFETIEIDPPLGGWTRIAVESFGLSVLVPVWVYSTGLAINAKRVSLTQTLAAPFVPVFIVLFVIAMAQAAVYELLPPESERIGDWVSKLPLTVFVEAASIFAGVVTLAVLVSAWRLLGDGEGVAPSDPLG